MEDGLTAGLHFFQPNENRSEILSKILRSVARLKTIVKHGGPDNLIDSEISILKRRIEEWEVVR